MAQNEIKENEDFLKEQIITYIGNKRKLLSYINSEIEEIKKKLKKDKISCADLFSGSGVVARIMKQHSDLLIVNDLEKYSEIINSCYLTNNSDFNKEKYKKEAENISKSLKKLKSGIISKNYAPKNDKDIKKGERVFYSTINAKIIDTIMQSINSVDKEYQKYFLAPLLYEASVHANTGGVFKGFYKSKKTGIGKYGGDGENALKRILGTITLKEPIFSNFECKTMIYREDINKLVKKLPELDVVYLDPPYDQHPYGSNYFMLNTIIEQKIGNNLSEVSGIPKDWNKSSYNKKTEAFKTFEDLIKNLKATFIIISYNSEGFINYDDMKKMLEKYGKVKIKEINYNTYRAGRNLKNRDIHVKEYLFILQK